MHQLTPAGQQIVNDLSQRHGFSPDAVTHMMFAVLHGHGSMAQFSHPEFGGSGQWMRGGMTMVGDMFNNSLKGSVDSLCSEIANILNNQPGLLQSGTFQSQTQSSGQQAMGAAPLPPSELFVPDPQSQWYPAELGVPNAYGSQNNVRYAYFADARRLAVDTNGDVWVYDTLEHQIGGFSQQQGASGSIVFSSQFGNVNLASLPVVYRHGQPVTVNPSTTTDTFAPSGVNTPSVSRGASAEIFEAIERLGELKTKGILSDDEFNAKKAELLGRL